MNRPLSDDERRAIDMRRVDAALAAFIDTPLDQLDESKLLDELDRALTPGNMRQAIEMKTDDPVEWSPKRAAHHEVGGAEDDDLDEGDEFSPSRWNITPSGGEHLSDEPAADAVADDRDKSEASDTGFVYIAEEKGNNTASLDDAASSGADSRTLQPPVPERQSADHGLNISSGLRDLIARRNHNEPSVSANEHYEDHADTGDSGPSDLAPSETARPDDTNTNLDLPADPDQINSAAAELPPLPVHDDAPIPLRSQRLDGNSSSTNTFEGLRTWFDDRDSGQKKKLKFLAAGLVVLSVLGVVQSCIPSGSDSLTAPNRAAETIESAAPQSIAPGEIPVPDSAVGVLAPTTVSARCPDGSTDARLAFSSDKSTAWICQRALGIDGAVLEMTFPHPVVVTDVFLVPGFDYIEPSGIDRWVEHRVVTRAQWSIGGQRFVQEINPSRSGTNMAIPAVETQHITLTIMETAEPSEGGTRRGFNFGTAGGSDDDSFAVSLIRITGHQP